ncbi:MAG: hypothetical protein KAS52_03270 [Candidatus Heimdallarchaeota archaeon]|nr:hypothetical protein [Candidatus Heimdallarchaeota archaeon]
MSITLDEGLYYWKLRASDAAFNLSNWTVTYNFTVDTTVPGIPVLDSPENLETITTNQPFLEWSTLDADFYQIQISNVMNFSALMINTITSNPSYQLSIQLADGVWYWRVRGYDIAGNEGYWSATWWFNVETIIVPEIERINFITFLVTSLVLVSAIIAIKRKTKL